MYRTHAALVTAVLVLATAAPASATSVEPASSPSEATPHCVGTAVPMGTPMPATGPATVCFPTFAQAISHATDGAVALPLSASPLDFTDQMATASAGSSVIGIDWEDPNFECCFAGWSYTWTVANDYGCTGGRNYYVDGMGSMDNQVSSAKAYGGCSRYDHWEHNYGQGARINCAPSCATMGVMNDATSSERWFDAP